MRRTCLALFVIILISLMTPPKALALIDWLEHMSGPGRFRGYGVQVKLFCFGKEDSEATRDLDLRLSLVRTLNQRIKTLTDVVPTLTLFSNADGGSLVPLSDLVVPTDTLATKSVILGAQSNPLQETAHDISTTLVTIIHLTSAHARAFSCADRAERTALCNAARNEVTRFQTLAELAKATADELDTPPPLLISSFGGNDFSGCQGNKALTRTTSLNLAVQNMRAAGEPGGYAGGHDIRLVTVIPTIVWNPLRAMNPKLDFFDFGAGAGVYTFSSPGGVGTFDRFSGLILEPVRVNAHVSKAIAERHWWLAIPNATVGLVLFTKGIEEGAFGNLGDKPSPRIPGEWVKDTSIFFDVSPFIHWMQERTRAKAAR